MSINHRKCPICLSEIEDLAIFDTCFHSFCFFCIGQWLEISKSCPLCKTKNESIIINIDEESMTYERIWIEKNMNKKKNIDSNTIEKRIAQFRKKVYNLKLEPMITYTNDPPKESIIDKVTEFMKREISILLGHYDNDKLDKYEKKTEVTIVFELVKDLLLKYRDIRNEKAFEKIRIFFFDNTEQFCNEIMNFIRSPYNMEEYDANVKYIEPMYDSE